MLQVAMGICPFENPLGVKTYSKNNLYQEHSESFMTMNIENKLLLKLVPKNIIV